MQQQISVSYGPMAEPGYLGEENKTAHSGVLDAKIAGGARILSNIARL
jgi:hypothetical protein